MSSCFSCFSLSCSRIPKRRTLLQSAIILFPAVCLILLLFRVRPSGLSFYSVSQYFTAQSIDPHPMSRNRVDLYVKTDAGRFSRRERNRYLRRLVSAYLAPFSSGFTTKDYEEVLFRTEQSRPPGSLTAHRCVMFQTIDNKVYLFDPRRVRDTEPQFCRFRIDETVMLLHRLTSHGRLPSTEFVFCVGDHVQTIVRKEYRGPALMESRPIFTVPSCDFSHDIPFAVMSLDKYKGRHKNWAETVDSYKRGGDAVPWDKKVNKAVFRGNFRPSTYYAHLHQAYQNWTHAGRGRLAFLGMINPGYLNISIGGQYGGRNYMLQWLTPTDYHRFKYIIYAEGTAFWADRLTLQLFGPSALLKQETPCGQWFEPLLVPYMHHIPVDMLFRNLRSQVQWARAHDDKIQEIVRAANRFADEFLTMDGMETYISVLLNAYAELRKDTEPVRVRDGSVSVTNLSLGKG